MKFRARVIIQSLTFTFLLMAAIIAVSMYFIVTAFVISKQREAVSLGDSLVAMVSNAVVASDLAALQEIVGKVSQYDEVGYVRISDAAGEVMAEAGDAKILSYPFIDVAALIAGQEEGLFAVRKDVQMEGMVFGQAEVYFVADRIVAFINVAKSFFLLLLIVGVSATIVFAYWFSSRLVSQWEDLRQAALIVADGRFGFSLDVKGQDETAQTVRAFNRMSESLQQMYTSLRRRERENRAIIDNVLDGLITIDEKGTVMSFNPAAERIFGYGAKEVLGSNVRMLMPSPFHEEHDSYLANYLNTGDAKIIGIGRQVSGLRKDRSTFPMDLSVSETEVQGQRIFTGIVRDITERVRAEEEIQVSQALLEKQADQLRDLVELNAVARDQAEAAAQAKSDFLANMSHEIRTPMNAIIGLSHLALQTRLDEQQADYVAKINSSAKGLLGIINDILDFSKIEAEKLDLEIVQFDLAEVLQKVDTLIGLQAREKGLKFSFSLAPGLPRFLMGDPLRLGQVLLNLAGNSVKFTDAGGIEISVARVDEERGNSGGLMLRFQVNDTGIGIAEEHVGKLFQAFSQADGSTTRKFGGTGLGLMISKRLVEMMQGDIQVESVYGEGTTFAFTANFTLGKVPGELLLSDIEIPDVESAPGTVLEDAGALAGLRVLLVEDNEINQQVAREILTKAGAAVHLAENGAVAVRLAGADIPPFDVVLMDLQMPEMDGFEATRQLRRKHSPQVLPILAMTAHAFEEERERCLAAGMQAHVSKPFDVDGLIMTLRTWGRPQGLAGHDMGQRRMRQSFLPQGGQSELPDKIDGINMAEARRRMMDNDVMLARLLRNFARRYGDAADDLRKFAEEADFEKLSFLVHTLKGAAGNLGADDLVRVTEALEEASGKQEQAELQKRLGEMEAELNRLTGAIRAWDAPPSQVQPAEIQEPEELDYAAARQAVAALYELLAERNLGAGKAAEALAALLAGSHDELLERVGRAVERLDFSEAEAALGELQKKLSEESED